MDGRKTELCMHRIASQSTNDTLIRIHVHFMGIFVSRRFDSFFSELNSIEIAWQSPENVLFRLVTRDNRAWVNETLSFETPDERDEINEKKIIRFASSTFYADQMEEQWNCMDYKSRAKCYPSVCVALLQYIEPDISPSLSRMQINTGTCWSFVI